MKQERLVVGVLAAVLVLAVGTVGASNGESSPSSPWWVILGVVSAVVAAFLSAYVAFWKDRTRVRIEVSPVINRDRQREILHQIMARVYVLSGNPLVLTEAGLSFNNGTEWQYEPPDGYTRLVGYDLLPRGLAAGGDPIEHAVPCDALGRMLGEGTMAMLEENVEPPVEWWFRDARGHTYRASIEPGLIPLEMWRRAMGQEPK